MEETLLEELKKLNMYKNNNYIFSGSEVPIPDDYSLYKPLINKEYDDKYTYVFNYTDDGIGILPLYDGFMENEAAFINKDSITKVDVVKKFGYYLIYIIVNNQYVMPFRANKKSIDLASHKDNLKKFIDDYGGNSDE